MGKKVPIRASCTRNLATLIAAGAPVKASCSKCGEWKEVDLLRLILIKGETYDLWNRRTSCRITPGCPGKNRFHVHAGRGSFEPMWD